MAKEAVLHISSHQGLDLGRIQLKGPIPYSRKADGSLFTPIERKAERRIKQQIVKAFPDDAVKAEALRTRPGSNGFTWHLDFDGTYSFVRNEDTFSLSVGLEHRARGARHGELVAGLVHAPRKSTLYAGCLAEKSTINGIVPTRERFRQKSPAEDAVTNVWLSRMLPEQHDYFGRLYRDLEMGKLVSHGGSHALAIAEMLGGNPAGYIVLCSDKRPFAFGYSFAGASYLLQSIGGRFSDGEGSPLVLGQEYRSFVFSQNATIHKQLLKWLRASPQ